tara:strand:+ start:197 stop:394 length:198 start_codon:yes stop_codon:yes gene_type:complete
MDFLEKILSLQNDELLIKIAIDKFKDLESRKKFVKKYDKVNFRKLKISKHKKYDSYLKRIKKFKL